MSFVIRAALVIGALSWLALQSRDGGTPDLPVGRADLTEAALTAWEALPGGAREAALAAGGAEIARRAGAGAASPRDTGPASRDTLVDTDRTLPWRGAQAHRDPN